MPLRCHTRRIEVALKPRCSASVRVLQCVAAAGLECSVTCQMSRLHLGRDGGRAPRARCVLAQRIDAALQEPLAPQRHLTTVQSNLVGDVLVLPAWAASRSRERAAERLRLDASALGQDPQLALGHASSSIVSATRIAPASWALEYAEVISSTTSSALH
jgi:hypothetical protein